MAWRVTKHRPRYLKSELVRTYAGEQPDYFDVEKNKWFSCDTGSELIGTINGVAYNGSAYVLAPTVIVNAGDNLTTLDPLTYDYPVAEMSFTTIVGDMYEFSFQLNRTDNGIVVYTSGSTLVGSTIASKSLLIPTTATLNTYKVTLVAQTTTTFIHIWSASVASGALTKIDNLTCFPLEITPTTEINESRNYMNHIVHADSQGNPLYVEELPKIKYENVIKAEEYLGKNACTGWVTFDGSTTPPMIKGNYNVSAVIRTATGTYDVYFKELMDNTSYTVSHPTLYGTSSGTVGALKYLHKVTLTVYSGGSLTSAFNDISIQIFGGRN